MTGVLQIGDGTESTNPTIDFKSADGEIWQIKRGTSGNKFGVYDTYWDNWMLHFNRDELKIVADQSLELERSGQIVTGDYCAVDGDTVNAALAGKASVSHTHTSSDIPNLPSTIDNKINALDVKDTSVQGKVVTAVSETDGKISVTRKGYDAYDIATADVLDATELITTYNSGPSSTNAVLYRRPATALWNYIKGKSDAIYATQSALTARIPKVTGTDNAVVRFNGTEGMVQNSGVKILDDNILITPNGQRVTENAINGTEGTLGAVNFLNLSTTSTYRNQPIILQYVSRNRAGYVIVNLAGGSTAGNISSATVSTIVLTGSIQIYYKISNNILYLYYNKSENYDNMSITFLGIGQYQAVGLSLTWVNTIQSSTSGLTAATLLTFRANMYMDGYSKASSVSAITTSDTVKGAIGKLEKGLENVTPNSFGVVRYRFIQCIGDNNSGTIYGVVCRFKYVSSESARAFTLQVNARTVVHNISIYAGKDGLNIYNNSYGINDSDSPIYGYSSSISGDSTYKLVTIYMKMVGYRYGASVVRVELPVYYYGSTQYIKDIEYPNYEYVTTLPSGYVTATVNAVARYDKSGNDIETTYMKASPAYIELRPGSSAGNGGFIDFHFNGSTADYTSRIIELASGNIGLNSNKVTVNGSIRYKSLYVAGTAYTVTADDGYSIYRVSGLSQGGGVSAKFVIPALPSTEFGREITIVCEGTGYRNVYYIGCDGFDGTVGERIYTLRGGEFVKLICGNGYWFIQGVDRT